MRRLSQIQWAEIPGYGGQYVISEMGNIYNVKKKRYVAIYKQEGLFRANLSFNGVARNHSIEYYLNLAFAV